MKRMLSIALLAAAGCAPLAPQQPSASDRAALQSALSGRMAGPQVNCIDQRSLRSNRSIGEGAILFEGVGRAIYVNSPPSGCPLLRSGRTLVTRSIGGQLCRGDIVSVIDMTSGMHLGSCALGGFTPYRLQRR